MHTTGGYMVYTATTFKYAFDYKQSDIYWYPPEAFSSTFFIFDMFLMNLVQYRYINALYSDYRCTADCGWITGHSYVTYGPMLNGASVIVYEGVISFFLKHCYLFICVADLEQMYRSDMLSAEPKRPIQP